VSTGFSRQRAVPHNVALQAAFQRLADRGYRPFDCGANGDRPDLRISDRDRRRAYVDVKVPEVRTGNVAIKRYAFETYARIVLMERAEVYVVSVHADDDWLVDTVDTLRARILAGPRRPTGNGSLTDWLLFGAGGTPFDDYFPSLKRI
jgi:hypothetical protein